VFMFRDGDVKGEMNKEACEKLGIKVVPGLNLAVSENLTWATNEIVSGLES